MASTIKVDFSITGNFSPAMDGMIEATGKLVGKIDEVRGGWQKFSDIMVLFNNTSDVLVKLADSFADVSRSGISLDKAMHELEAISGVTGDKLKEIEGYARQSAKAFGTDAAEAVKAYQNLLGQLSPELAEYPEALKAMGDSVQTVSKLMGNDAVAAADVLTTAMNQYGVDLSDPIEASRKMAEMMNVMAKAGQEGSAELPAIKQALQNAGMAAKGANVSFEETNAAIQVLDKAGKKGAEGGVALRNVLAQIGQGRFAPKQAAEAMAQAGVDVIKLADKSLTLKDRLDMLKPLLGDTALLSEFFGKENANAAMALINNTDELGRLTEAVTGSQSAVEQADIVMQSYQERQARINQQMEDLKISIFQATGDVSLWIGTVTQALVPVSQLVPLLMGMGTLMKGIAGLNWAGMWQRVLLPHEDGKPTLYAGVLSVATDRERQETVYSILNAYLREKNKEARVFVLHRLDRESSGLMLFAKSQQVQNIMQERWNELVPKRTFQAVIEGHLPAKGTITSWLTENKNFKVFSSSRENGGLKSVTHFSTLQHGTRYSLVEFELETARKNQIRAQLEELKKPIVGDKKYGATRNPIKRMCLHANELVLNYPFTDLQHRFRSPLPDRMQAMVMPAPDAEKTR